MTYKAFHGPMPEYSNELLIPYYPKKKPLRSAGLVLLAVPESTLRSKGDTVFAVLAPPL